MNDQTRHQYWDHDTRWAVGVVKLHKNIARVKVGGTVR